MVNDLWVYARARVHVLNGFRVHVRMLLRRVSSRMRLARMWTWWRAVLGHTTSATRQRDSKSVLRHCHCCHRVKRADATCRSAVDIRPLTACLPLPLPLPLAIPPARSLPPPLMRALSPCVSLRARSLHNGSMPHTKIYADFRSALLFCALSRMACRCIHVAGASAESFSLIRRVQSYTSLTLRQWTPSARS